MNERVTKENGRLRLRRTGRSRAGQWSAGYSAGPPAAFDFGMTAKFTF